MKNDLVVFNENVSSLKEAIKWWHDNQELSFDRMLIFFSSKEQNFMLKAIMNDQVIPYPTKEFPPERIIKISERIDDFIIEIRGLKGETFIKRKFKEMPGQDELRQEMRENTDKFGKYKGPRK